MSKEPSSTPYNNEFNELHNKSLDDKMSTIGSLYHGYRSELAKKIIDLLHFSHRLPEVRREVWGESPDFDKQAASPSEMLMLGGLFPLMYLYAAHLRKDEREGEQLGIIRKFIKNHPVITTGGVIALFKQLSLK
jgi:hypothetical protein